MPKPLRVFLVLVLCLIAASPVVIAPGIAESYGYDRSTGSSIGAFTTMALFAIIGGISFRVSKKQAKRELGQEVNRLLYPYRDEEDKGKP